MLHFKQMSGKEAVQRGYPSYLSGVPREHFIQPKFSRLNLCCSCRLREVEHCFFTNPTVPNDRSSKQPKTHRPLQSVTQLLSREHGLSHQGSEPGPAAPNPQQLFLLFKSKAKTCVSIETTS